MARRRMGATHGERSRSARYAPAMPVIQVLVFVLGALVVGRTLLSAVRVFVLPRGSNDTLARLIFRGTRRLFNVVAGPRRPYPERDRLMAYFGPVSVVILPAVWLLIVILGYTAMFWAIGVGSPYDAFVDSGSSLFTLGFAHPATVGGEALAFSEAAIGLGFVALLVSYLPTIYAAFSRRELFVRMLEGRADSPPSPVVLLTRLHRLRGLGELGEMWEAWERWFAELEETHTSLTVLVHYRSQQPGLSWVNAAGAMLDAAAIVRSSVAIPMDVRADLMIRAGYLALRRISDVFGIPYPQAPSQGDSTTIDRERFEAALDVLDRSGVPLVDDRDQAWRDFNGWRVNYDAPLRGLEALTVVPAPWWERPMRSAWVTDEPIVEEAAARGA
jgi:hypothetical protein